MIYDLPLANGGRTYVDEDVASWACNFLWSVSGNGYAVTRRDKKIWYLHRCVLNPPYPYEVDHKNGNRLDNRRSNLRAVTHTVNMQNLVPREHRTFGVCWYPKGSCWRAYITRNGCWKHLGYFATKEEALDCRNAAVKEGEA